MAKPEDCYVERMLGLRTDVNYPPASKAGAIMAPLALWAALPPGGCVILIDHGERRISC
jgi:hypothetical protein